MKTLTAFALLITSTILSAQQLSQNPQVQLTASAAKVEESDLQLLRMLDFADASRAATVDASKAVSVAPSTAAGAEHPALESAAMPEPPAFRSTKELERASRIPEFHKKIFISEAAVYTAANIFDGITTVRGVHRGFTESSFPKGASEFLGSRPGATRYVLTMGAMQTVATFASYRLQHSRSRVLRMLGHSIMAEGIVDHTSGFVNNLMLGNHP